MKPETPRYTVARMHDYMLGGSHHTDHDRVAAEKLLQILPSARNGARLNRWFLRDAVQRLVQRGFTHFIDFASGLPVEGHIHQIAPDAKVIYTDLDPTTVEQSRQLLQHDQRTLYLNSDIRAVDHILEQAKEFFGQRRVGFCLSGISFLLDDAEMANILARIHQWSAPGSEVIISWMIGGKQDQRIQDLLGTYSLLASPLHLRSFAQVHQLMTGWNVTDPGLLPLNVWVDVESWKSNAPQPESLGDTYGVILQK